MWLSECYLARLGYLTLSIPIANCCFTPEAGGRRSMRKNNNRCVAGLEKLWKPKGLPEIYLLVREGIRGGLTEPRERVLDHLSYSTTDFLGDTCWISSTFLCFVIISLNGENFKDSPISWFLGWTWIVCDWDHSYKMVFAARKAQAEDSILSGDAIQWFTVWVLSLYFLIQGWCFKARIDFANISKNSVMYESPERKDTQSNLSQTTEIPVHSPKHLPLLQLPGAEPRHLQTERDRFSFTPCFSGLHFFPLLRAGNCKGVILEGFICMCPKAKKKKA